MTSLNGRSSKSAMSSASYQQPSLQELLDPNDFMPGHTTADLYSLRHLTLRSGLPDTPSWIRAQAWKVLLGYLPPEKKEWSSTLSKRRDEYYRFVADLSPPLDETSLRHYPSDPLSDRDTLLDQIYKDLSRSKKNGFSFYQRPVHSSASCPLAPPPPIPDGSSTKSNQHRLPVKRIENRHNILKRLASINQDVADHLFSEQAIPTDLNVKEKGQHAANLQRSAQHPPSSQADSLSNPMSPPIFLSPPSPSRPFFHSVSGSLDSDNHVQGSASNEQTSKTLLASPIQAPNGILDRNWHSLLRILYLFALLNPSIGYVQGMNEALFTLFYAFGTASNPPRLDRKSAQSTRDPSQLHDSQASSSLVEADWDLVDDTFDYSAHAEADAFWCFSILIGEVRDLYEFDGIDHALAGLRKKTQPNMSLQPSEGNASNSGMAGALKRFSLRLKWLDADLWSDLKTFSLDPRLPYYSLRWLACLLSTELSLPSVLRIWDALLAEQETTSAESNAAKIEFLIDVCCAMLLFVKHQLPRSSDHIGDDQDAFSHGMKVLQTYPDDDIGPVLEMAAHFRQRRLAADLTGDGPPKDDQQDVSSGVESVKARAAHAFRGWASRSASASPSPSSKPSTHGLLHDINLSPATGSWFTSMSRNFSSSSTFPTPPDSSAEIKNSPRSLSTTSTPSRSVGGMLARYAEVIQSSDAAANLSKASTNLTAKALVSFGSRTSRESTPESLQATPSQPHARMMSFGTVGASFFQKTRTNSNSSNPPAQTSPQTPDMARWSRDTMPDFPLPNVTDSPAGRTEYTDSFGKRISTMYKPVSPGSPTISEVQSEAGGLGSLPLPSLRKAAKLGIFPRQKESPRAVGPKPLLLLQSARPPREGSSNGYVSSLDEPSRKVSSGPMGHGSGFRASGQAGVASTAGSVSGMSSTAPSEANSGRSSSGSIDTSLTSHQQIDLEDTVPNAHRSHQTNTQGSTKEATVSARVFARALAAAEAKVSESGTVPGTQLEFGKVSSSSDVPLVAGPTSIARPRQSTASRKRGSSSTVGSKSTSGSLRSTRVTSNESLDVSSFGFRDSTTTDGTDELHQFNENIEAYSQQQSWMTGEAGELTDKRSAESNGFSMFEAPRLAPVPRIESGMATPILTSSHANDDSTNVSTPTERLQRFSPIEEHVRATDLEDNFAEALGFQKVQRSSSSNLNRSKRFTKARTGSSSSSITNGSSGRRPKLVLAERKNSLSSPVLEEAMLSRPHKQSQIGSPQLVSSPLDELLRNLEISGKEEQSAHDFDNYHSQHYHYRDDGEEEEHEQQQHYNHAYHDRSSTDSTLLRSGDQSTDSAANQIGMMMFRDDTSFSIPSFQTSFPQTPTSDSYDIPHASHHHLDESISAHHHRSNSSEFIHLDTLPAS